MNLSHATTKKVEFYVVRFDNKEFKVKVIDCQRHHKDFREITEIEVIQTPSFEDRKKINKIIKEEIVINGGCFL
jgi:ribosomal 50S subunit-recycling heat shock protein